MPLSHQTAFDKAIARINQAGYHNHRRPVHSDTVSEGIHSDLLRICETYRKDHARGVIREWLNVKTPGDRQRNIDLFVGEEDSSKPGTPQINLVRFCLENKSVITAHRNTPNRFDDLTKVMSSLHAVRSQAIVVATVLVGVCGKVLNIPDGVAKLYKKKKDVFEKKVLPRLSSGDERLFDEFDFAVSENTPGDIERTLTDLRTLPVRDPGMTHEKAFDFVMLVPVRVDNVHPASIERDNPYGIDVDKDYERMLQTICAAYRARWHPMA